MIKVFNKKLMVICLLTIFSKSNGTSSSSLSQIIESALTNNPALIQIKLQEKMQIQETAQVGVLPDPTITYTWFGENVETRVGPQEQKFGIQQKIPWPGKLIAKKNINKKKVDITKTKLLGMKSLLVYKIRLIWSDIQYFHLSNTIIDSTVHLYKQWKTTLLKDYQSGNSSYTKIIKMDNEIEILKDALKTNQRILMDKNSELSELTNFKKGKAISFDDRFFGLSTQIGSQVFPKNFNSNPLIKSAEAKKSFWKDKEKLSKNGFIPDFTIGVGYIQTGKTDGMSESGKDPWLVNLGVTIPLYFRKEIASIKENQLGQKKESAYKNEQNLFLKKSREHGFNQISEAIRKRNLYENIILPNIEQSIQVGKQSYTSGNGNFMQLLDDYRLRLDSQRKIYKSLKNEFQGKAKLLWILGDESTIFSFPYTSTKVTSRTGKGK